jgi:hypothetical protein
MPALPGSPAELERLEKHRVLARIGELEARVKTLETVLGDAKLDRLVRQVRRLRKYIAAWLQED